MRMWRAHSMFVLGKGSPSANGESRHHSGEPKPVARPAPGLGDHSGRSPDLRVVADFGPSRGGAPVACAKAAHRLQLRGQSWFWADPHHVPFSPGNPGPECPSPTPAPSSRQQTLRHTARRKRRDGAGTRVMVLYGTCLGNCGTDGQRGALLRSDSKLDMRTNQEYPWSRGIFSRLDLCDVEKSWEILVPSSVVQKIIYMAFFHGCVTICSTKSRKNPQGTVDVLGVCPEVDHQFPNFPLFARNAHGTTCLSKRSGRGDTLQNEQTKK